MVWKDIPACTIIYCADIILVQYTIRNL